jgi:hypothetical protein
VMNRIHTSSKFPLRAPTVNCVQLVVALASMARAEVLWLLRHAPEQLVGKRGKKAQADKDLRLNNAKVRPGGSAGAADVYHPCVCACLLHAARSTGLVSYLEIPTGPAESGAQA